MAYMKGKDMLLLADGSTYHLGAKKGEVYSRIITVGGYPRAKAISTVFDEFEGVKESTRGFHIYNGKYKGVGISVIAIGMGAPMMDFMIREASFVDEGPMACIRLGTCGLLNKDLDVGTVVSAGKGSVYVYTNFGAFSDGCMNDATVTKDSKKFLITKPEHCNADLNRLMVQAFQDANIKHHDGLNSAGEFFYSTQGRSNSHFDDCNNEDLVECMVENGVDCLEMETHTLFYLGNHRTIAPLATAGCAIGILNRINKDGGNISTEELHDTEIAAGRACMEALAKFEL